MIAWVMTVGKLPSFGVIAAACCDDESASTFSGTIMDLLADFGTGFGTSLMFVSLLEDESSPPSSFSFTRGSSSPPACCHEGTEEIISIGLSPTQDGGIGGPEIVTAIMVLVRAF